MGESAMETEVTIRTMSGASITATIDGDRISIAEALDAGEES